MKQVLKDMLPFNIHIQLVIVLGITQELLFKYSPHLGKYPAPNDVARLDIEHFYTLCFFMVGGLLLSTAALLAEIYCLKQKKGSSGRE